MLELFHSLQQHKRVVNKHDPIIKVEEQFKESSEVSNTLLGVNRAEVQVKFIF